MRVLLILIVVSISYMGFTQNPYNFTYGGEGYDGSTGVSLIGDTIIMTTTINNSNGVNQGFSILYLSQNGDSISPYISQESNMNWSAKFINKYGILASTGRYEVNNNNLDMALTVINDGITKTYHYGGPQGELGYDLEILADSGYLIVGTTQSYDVTGYSDVYIIRTDKNGDSLWTRSFGEINDQWAYGIEKESDSIYVVAGKWVNLHNNSMDAFAMKINLQGDTLAFKLYGNHLQNFGQSLCKTSDGYAIAGWSSVDYGGFYSRDAVLYKIDTNLNLLWTKYYGEVDDEDILDVISTYDNGFVLVGYSEVYGKGEDVYIVRTDSQGDTLWTKTLGGDYDDRAYSVVQTPDSGFAVTGHTYSYGAGNTDAFFLKLKPNGETTVSISLQAEPNILNINIYPNPAKDNITMDFINPINSESEFIIYNSLGQIIKELKVQKQQVSINISIVGLNSGVYLCELRTANKTVGRGKFIKQ